MDWLDSEFVSRGIAILVAIGLVWLIFRPRYDLVIKIREGKPVVTKGKITGAHLQIVEETCARHGIQTGWIGAVRAGKRRQALRFSGNIPPECRQQLRNLWPVHA